MIRDTDPQPTGSAADFLPSGRLTMQKLREAAATCRGCDLYEHATQAVFGEGPVDARLMLVGEKPGDQEDKQGRPFVGPAGRLLEKALVDAGIDRKTVYLTNVVKHFKYTPRGKRRIHSKPDSRQISACRPWLNAEVQLVRPQVLVALGATAAQGIFGPQFRVSRQRGEILETELAPHCYATLHPAALVRIPDRTRRDSAYGDFLADLKIAANLLESL